MFKTLDRNKYAGECAGCNRRVSAGQGVAELPQKGGKWQVRCRPCVNGETPTPIDPTPELEDRPTVPMTEEQLDIVGKFGGGDSLAVQAGAGTGKTTTLIGIAKSTDRQGTFISFGKDIARDAGAKLPRNVSAFTAHKLAYNQVGKHYRHRRNVRISGDQMARILGIDPFFCQVTEDDRKVVQPGKLASYVARAVKNFCSSTDKAPGTRHVPYVEGIDLPTPEGERTFANNDALGAHVADAINAYWSDVQRTDGVLRFDPDHFLKIWELGELYGPPVIPGDFLMIDEAQDIDPVMLSVIEQQNKQTVFVGDSQQAIYEWRGAIDALAKVPATATGYLTNSFRFGPEIAEVANAILGEIEGAELRIVGRGQPGTVGAIDEPDAILTRTNAGAIRAVLAAAQNGRTACLVGGASDVEGFAKAALALQTGRRTDHPELSIFGSWAEVQAYVANDILGDELAPLVKLIDDNGAQVVLDIVRNGASEEDADVVVSTAHKAKGREWDAVQIGGDFPPASRLLGNVGELRLLYVAVTRAKLALDVTGCAAALEILGEEPAD